MTDLYASPSTSFLVGMATIIIAMLALLAIGFLVFWMDAPKIRIEWFGLGCVTAAILLLAVFFKYVETLK